MFADGRGSGIAKTRLRRRPITRACARTAHPPRARARDLHGMRARIGLRTHAIWPRARESDGCVRACVRAWLAGWLLAADCTRMSPGRARTAKNKPRATPELIRTTLELFVCLFACLLACSFLFVCVCLRLCFYLCFCS